MKMLRFVVPLVLASTALCFHHDQPIKSAASAAQIRFAIENKYDDTGPGAKSKEYAYNTYKTLEEALVGYLDDPDTKLPDHEREKAVHLLYQKHNHEHYIPDPVTPKLPLYKPKPIFTSAHPIVNNHVFHDAKPSFSAYDSRLENTGAGQDGLVNRFKWHKVQSVKTNPLSLAHYTRDPEVGAFDPSPRYSFSYGVHDKKTGDLKSAQEALDNGKVHGYYSFRDADGKQRTVQYTADDKLGFRATVDRSFTTDTDQ